MRRACPLPLLFLPQRNRIGDGQPVRREGALASASRMGVQSPPRVAGRLRFMVRHNGRRRWALLATVATLLAGAISCASLAQERPIPFRQLPKRTIKSRLLRVAGKNGARQGRLEAIFAETGCSGARLAEQPVNKSQFHNVICTLPGSGDSSIVVGAHFDHVELGEGVVDNWSGAALLPSLFESLKARPRKHTFVFIGFAEEENGLVGSRAYVLRLTPENAAHIRLMVNIDSLALGPTQVWLAHSDPAQADALDGVAHAMKIPFGIVDAESAEEDSTPFRDRKIPTLMLHSLTPGTSRILHSANDNMRAVQMNDYYGSYLLIAEYLALTDGRLD
jgi:Peptidase family M28